MRKLDLFNAATKWQRVLANILSIVISGLILIQGIVGTSKLDARDHVERWVAKHAGGAITKAR